MRRGFMALAAGLLVVSTVSAESINGEYLETRNADVWTGPCFANGEMGIVGNKAIMAWKVTEGSFNDVKLDGLSVVAIVLGDGTFGVKKDIETRALMIVDEKANKAQQTALVAMAAKLSGNNIQTVVGVKSAQISMATQMCEAGGCAVLYAGGAQIETRCLCDNDRICGHEELFYPTLAKVKDEYAAYAIKNRYTGNGLGQTFVDDYNRSAVIAKFAL